MGSVHVGVGVEPEEADFLIGPAMEGGDSGYGSGGDGVIAAQDQREMTAGQDFDYEVRQAFAGLGDLGEEAGFAGSFGGKAFGLGYGDVASVGYLVAQNG
jgi:hypothetical protein